MIWSIKRNLFSINLQYSNNWRNRSRFKGASHLSQGWPSVFFQFEVFLLLSLLAGGLSPLLALLLLLFEGTFSTLKMGCTSF